MNLKNGICEVDFVRWLTILSTELSYTQTQLL